MKKTLANFYNFIVGRKDKDTEKAVKMVEEHIYDYNRDTYSYLYFPSILDDIKRKQQKERVFGIK